jgi:hypothetical protein
MRSGIPVYALLLLLFSAFAVSAQGNRFEGYSIILDVPSTQKAAACSIRYRPPNTTVNVTDLDRSTPANIKPCAGSATRLLSSAAGTATFQSAAPDSSWCFTGEDKFYKIDFQGDEYSGPVSYIWPTSLSGAEGFYNVKDFGAKGDGATDDTLAIRSALAYVASRNGGVLRFPDGDYLVGSLPNYRPLVLPSGVTIQGVTGLHTGAATNNVRKINPSRIRLKGTNRTLFRIGECTEQVVMRDIELIAENNTGTIGVEAIGAYLTSQSLSFERVTFHSFFRGMSVYGLPQTDLNWQLDYVKVRECRFIFNSDAGIYTNIRNSNWKIDGSFFVNPQRTATQAADSMNFERVGAVIVEDTFGGGFPWALGGAFIKMLDTGPLTVIGSESEAITEAFIYNAVENPGAGDYSYPITFINSVFGSPIIFKARRTFVSTGSLYAANNFKADARVRVYSTGDRFCYDGATLACLNANEENFGGATVVFMTGQPSDGRVKGHPTYFGTDVEFGAPVKMPSMMFNSLPRDKEDGSMLYCPDCRRNSTPCQGGGGGAPAMVVRGQWSCL